MPSALLWGFFLLVFCCSSPLPIPPPDSDPAPTAQPDSPPSTQPDVRSQDQPPAAAAATWRWPQNPHSAQATARQSAAALRAGAVALRAFNPPFREPPKIHPSGLDTLGRFRAPHAQTLAPAHILALLDDEALAQRVLSRATPTAFKSLEMTHTVLRVELTLHPEDAKILGVDQIRAAFKPEGSTSYGSEFKRELAYARLAAHFGARAAVPIAERTLTLDPLLTARLRAVLNARQLGTLTTRAEALPDGERLYLRGSLQLWVEGYAPFIAHAHSTNQVLEAFASRLSRTSRIDLERDPMWQALSDMLLLDFLVDNVDRALECGSVRLPDGGQRLVMLDHGDALIWDHIDYSGSAEALFYRVQVLTPNAWAALQALDAPTLRALWQVDTPQALASASDVRRVLARKDLAIRHFSTLSRRSRSAAITFATASRSMVHVRP